MRADVSRYPCDLGDATDHPVAVAAVDRLRGVGPEDERPLGAFAAARLEDSQDGDSQWHGGGLVAFADEVQDAVTPQVSR